MGLLSTLFGVSEPILPPKLVSIFPQAAAQRVKSGALPVIQADKLILGKAEICHFVDVAAIITEKKHYESVRVGGSYHVFKGYVAHLGNSKSVPVTEPEYTKGILYITDKRIIFVATKFGFDKKISKLTAVTPYSDGTSLQFGSKTYSIILPENTVANLVLNLII